MTDKKEWGTSFAEQDFTYGRARIILPVVMTKAEMRQLRKLIKGLVERGTE